MQSRHLLFKYPTRCRPDRMFAVIDSIIRNLSNKVDYTILITADIDDATTYNQQVLLRLKTYFKYFNIKIVFGHSENKIHAINRDMEVVENVPWHDVVLVGDYIEFIVKGFDNIIRNAIGSETIFNTWNSHVLGFSDELSNEFVVPVINRARYKEYGYILNPKFKSKFALEHLIKESSCNYPNSGYEHSSAKIIKRKHPSNLYYSADLQMIENTKLWREDLVTLESNRHRHDQN